jgi:hypothetical protein
LKSGPKNSGRYSEVVVSSGLTVEGATTAPYGTYFFAFLH